ncbi:ABC transporter permease [Paludisphaera mucosa]|uniref:ABC-2 family transporter protein n=1 Tax=Paludisphaera mucosa TaxID=3030827 RepID=A0ABT6F5S5_9BACT|nr:hypothetical protein [Paludisphaera mucosa]MDG3002764.1 hypothetical protein [Paludisphaera mucosa]
MAFRLVPGPVFAYEWLRVSRRRRIYALRSAFVAVLLAGMASVWQSWDAGADGLDRRRLAWFGSSLYATLANLELTLVLLLAPAATAGSVCRDKTSGSLLLEMATGLADSEIVLGRLAAGLLPVVGLVLAAQPVLMLTTLLGGVDPIQPLRAFVVTLATAVLAGSLGFTLSIRGAKPHAVLGLSYAILVAWLIFPSVIGGILGLAFPGTVLVGLAIPLFAMQPYIVIADWSDFFPTNPLAATTLSLAWSVLGTTALIRYSIRTVRPAALDHRAEVRTPTPAEVNRAARRRRRGPLRLLREPSLDADPVLWREWRRLHASSWDHALWRAYNAITLFLFGVTVVWVIGALGLPAGDFSPFAAFVTSVLGLLLLNVRAAASLSEEAAQGNLDVLLATPLSTAEILGGKWWATYRLTVFVAAGPAAIGAVACLHTGLWLQLGAYAALIAAYAASATSLGLATAVWAGGTSRAPAWSAGAFLAASVGWLFVSFGLFGRLGNLESGTDLGSPVYGPLLGMALLSGHAPTAYFVEMSCGLVAWTPIHLLASRMLFRAACRSVPRRLGRMAARD